MGSVVTKFAATADVRSVEGGTIFEADLVVEVDCDTDGAPIIQNVEVQAVTDGEWTPQTPPKWLGAAFKKYVTAHCAGELADVAEALHRDRLRSLTNDARAYDRGLVA